MDQTLYSAWFFYAWEEEYRSPKDDQRAFWFTSSYPRSFVSQIFFDVSTFTEILEDKVKLAPEGMEEREFNKYLTLELKRHGIESRGKYSMNNSAEKEQRRLPERIIEAERRIEYIRHHETFWEHLKEGLVTSICSIWNPSEW
ncbi:hypothetical protein KY332_02050 [Candidatus Woesearchaeota archaeon]|nr:hypothetical protein [Candidatus Woesearchaeota archaeon]